MKRYQVQFCQLRVGSIFEFNHHKLEKTSKRTAKLKEYKRPFYFFKRDLVTTTELGNVIQEGIW